MSKAFLPLALLAVATAAHAETLIVGNKGEDTVSFIDLQTGVERARVKTGDMPHEVAISPDGKTAAVVAYGGTTIELFDVAKARSIKVIELTPNERPHGLVWLKDGRIVATTEGSRTLSIVDPAGRVGAVRTDQQGSHMVAVDEADGRAYVANVASGTVSVIDLEAGRKLRDLDVGGRPEGIALTPDGTQLWVGDLSAPRVQVFETERFAKLGEVAIDPVAIRVAISPDGKTAVTSNVASGTLSVMDVPTRQLTKSIKVGGGLPAGQVTILFSSDGKRIYVAETGRDQIAEVDLATGKVLRRIAVGRNGDGLAIAP